MDIELIKGICPIVAAPFAKDETVDYDSLRNLVATLAKGGCHALTLFGIAGEYYKLNESEQREMMRVTIDEAHRHNVPVIVSNTRHSTANAIEFAREIQAAGADCMMFLPPFFLKPGADLIYQHALAVAKAVPSMPVMMQYAPEQTGVAIAPDVFAKLTGEAPNVVYYKIECKPAGKYISSLIGKLGDKIRVFAGNAGYQMLETFDRGAVGAMPGCSMFDLYLDIYRLGLRKYENLGLVLEAGNDLATKQHNKQVMEMAEQRRSKVEAELLAHINDRPRIDNSQRLLVEILDLFTKEKTKSCRGVSGVNKVKQTKAYVVKYSGENTKLGDIDKHYILGFIQFLNQVECTGKSRAIKKSTATQYYRCLKSAFNFA